MAAAPPEPPVIVARRDMILDRLATLEGQADSLMQRQTVEAREFVVRDHRPRFAPGSRCSNTRRA
jgi:hypothetical protein